MSDIKSKILSKIDHEKPISHNYFVALDVVRGLCIALILFFAGVLLAFLLWDWVLIPQIIDFTVDNVLYVFLNLFPLILLLTFIFSLICYLIYRQTDWLMVKKRGLVLLMAILFIILITAFSLGVIQNNTPVQKSLKDIDIQLQQTPIKTPRPKLPDTKIRQGSILFAQVLKVENTENFESRITVGDRMRSITFDVKKDLVNELQVGDLVKLQLDPNNLNKVVKITKIRTIQVEPVTFSGGLCNTYEQKIEDPSQCSKPSEI